MNHKVLGTVRGCKYEPAACLEMSGRTTRFHESLELWADRCIRGAQFAGFIARCRGSLGLFPRCNRQHHCPGALAEQLHRSVLLGQLQSIAVLCCRGMTSPGWGGSRPPLWRHRRSSWTHRFAARELNFATSVQPATPQGLALPSHCHRLAPPHRHHLATSLAPPRHQII